MTRYFLNLHNRIGFVPDEEGRDFADLAAATADAVDGIRSLLAEEVRKGELDLGGRLEIADVSGQIVCVVQFAEAVRIMRSGAQ